MEINTWCNCGVEWKAQLVGPVVKGATREEAMQKAMESAPSASDNTASREIALPNVGIFLRCGCDLGIKAHIVSQLYHAVQARLQA